MLQGSALEEERSSLIAKQASLENEIKQLKQQLSNNSEKETEAKRRLEGMLDVVQTVTSETVSSLY
jgi:predicted  nucleic acid-binding Zn-ribbon protein